MATLDFLFTLPAYTTMCRLKFDKTSGQSVMFFNHMYDESGYM